MLGVLAAAATSVTVAAFAGPGEQRLRLEHRADTLAWEGGSAHGFFISISFGDFATSDSHNAKLSLMGAAGASCERSLVLTEVWGNCVPASRAVI